LRFGRCFGFAQHERGGRAGDRVSRAGHGNGGRVFLFSVILTTVGIQGGGGDAAWLWILTFVRMTGWVGGVPFLRVGGGRELLAVRVGLLGPCFRGGTMAADDDGAGGGCRLSGGMGIGILSAAGRTV
jgi:hypothetical protein